MQNLRKRRGLALKRQGCLRRDISPGTHLAAGVMKIEALRPAGGRTARGQPIWNGRPDCGWRCGAALWAELEEVFSSKVTETCSDLPSR